MRTFIHPYFPFNPNQYIHLHRPNDHSQSKTHIEFSIKNRLLCRQILIEHHQSVSKAEITENIYVQHIFTFVGESLDRKNVAQVCKQWLKMSLKAFDPTENHSAILLHHMNQNRVEAILKMLKDRRIDFTVHHQTLLNWACQNALKNMSNDQYNQIITLLLGHSQIDPFTQIKGSCCFTDMCVLGLVEPITLLLKTKTIPSSIDLKKLFQKLIARIVAYQQIAYDTEEQLNHLHQIINLLIEHIKFHPYAQQGLQEALLQANFWGIASIFQKLLDHPFIDLSCSLESFLDNARKQNHVDIVILLLKDRRLTCIPNVSELLEWACENGHLEVITEILKSHQYKQKVDIHHLIYIASLNGHLPIVQCLLLHLSHYDHHKLSRALLGTIERGHASIMQELLNTIDPQYYPESLYNSLMIAFQCGYLEIVYQILQHPRFHKLGLEDKKIELQNLISLQS